MLSVQDEEDFKSSDKLGVGSVILISGLLVHHVEEILDIAQVLIWLIYGKASLVSVAGSSYGGSASQYSVNMLVSFLLWLVDIGPDQGGVGLRVEGGESSYQGRHHAHGVRVVSECFDEFLETIVVGGVRHNSINFRLECQYVITN